MRRTARPTIEERDDLEDTRWKRKSYALAQRNALPIPLPNPVYPPPKVCPPPAVVIRPSRLRSRPPGTGYRPPTGYRLPGSNQSPLRQNYYQGQQSQPDHLPPLSEVSPGTGDFPLHRAPPLHRQLPTIQASPLDTIGVPIPAPELTTFKTPPPNQHIVSPPPPGPPNAAFSHNRPYHVPDSPPKLNHHISSPTRPNNIPTSPPPGQPYFNASPSRPANIPPSPPRSRDHPASVPHPVIPQDANELRPPTIHPTFNTFHPETVTAQPPPPTTFLQQHNYNAPSTPPPPVPRTPPALPSKPPPKVLQTKGLKVEQPTPSPPSPAPKTSPLKRTPQSPRPKEAPPAVPSYPSRQPESGYSSHDSLSTSPPESFITESTPPMTHTQSLSKPETPPEPVSHLPPEHTDLNSRLISPAREGSSLPSSGDARAETDFKDPSTSGNTSETNISPEESTSPSVGFDSHKGESDLPPEVPETSEFYNESKPKSSPSEDVGNLQSPQAASQPHTATSPSQHTSSSSPLPSERTPPSIRAAPSFQPTFPATPLLRRANLASKSESSLSDPCSSTTPRPSMSEGEANLPTPPSSPPTTRVDNVTPASSSSSSFPHGHGQNLVAEKEEEARHPESTSPDDGHDPTRGAPTDEMPDNVLQTTDNATSIPNAVNNISPASEELGAVPTKSAPETFVAYKTRFWILTVFSFICFLQTIVWGTFGPIAESAQAAFPSWDDSTIAAFPNWGPIIVVVFTFPMVWISERLGLQLAMVVCALFLTLGTMLRCFTSQEAAFTVLCHVSSVLFAFAACFTLSLPAMVAATWFPPSERITATAVGTLMCQLGAAAMYLGALVVRYPTGEPQDLSQAEREDIRGDIMILMYIHFGAAVLLLLAVVIYFPARPPTPPSASSTEERINYFRAIKKIFKKAQLVMVMVVVAFSFGVPVVWIGVLNLSLKEIDIHQEQAIGVAVTAVVCSSLSAFIAARITDKMYGHLKVTIMVLLGISSLFFLWFLLLTTKVIYPTLGQVYVAVTGGLCFEYTTVPLLVELAVEIGFPIPENVTGATLTFAFNLVALVFLGLFQIPNSGHLWVSCVLLACVSLAIIPLFFIKETHKRSDTDRKFI